MNTILFYKSYYDSRFTSCTIHESKKVYKFHTPFVIRSILSLSLAISGFRLTTSKFFFTIFKSKLKSNKFCKIYSILHSKFIVEHHKMKLALLFAIILPYVTSIAVVVRRPAILCDDDYCRSSDDPPMLERSLEEMALNPRALDPKGYK